MWSKGWREGIWSELDTQWDLIVIGGGITGAGIFLEAVRRGLVTLLVEGHDFASGTSSRSSKLVHGGFRYLKNAQVALTLESVREREHLLSQARGLVNPLGFLLTCYQGDPIPRWVFGAGLMVYDLLALHWGHRYYDAYDLRELCPLLSEEGLLGGYRYFDAQTDDARLVLRVIQEGVQAGGKALNYARVSRLLRSQNGQVQGVVLEDCSGGSLPPVEVRARGVINATGAWADELRAQVGGRNRLRRLRGSHLIFSSQRIPVTRAVSFLHPQDGRPVFAFPWEGVTLVGTTDVDHGTILQTDPSISPAEADYLLAAARHAFPCQELSLADVQATYSGVRPVIGSGKADPSRESREHVLWFEQGLVTVAGGKLTTFRRMGRAALRLAIERIPALAERCLPTGPIQEPLLPDPVSGVLQGEGLSGPVRLRLVGRFGPRAPEFLAAGRSAAPQDLQPVPGTPALWGELRWAAREEGVIHLDDLLLRRVRLGLLLPEGGVSELPRIRALVQPELGWTDSRWEGEIAHYTSLWKQCYYLT